MPKLEFVRLRLAIQFPSGSAVDLLLSIQGVMGLTPAAGWADYTYTYILFSHSAISLNHSAALRLENSAGPWVPQAPQTQRTRV